ncbi:MAG: citrate transporter [Oscillospiraceae bacterium]|nr:citrate transporter [Oscillospiraceae bacterium]
MIKDILKKNVMVLVFGAAALVSIIIAPGGDYISYIDSELLAVMFGFMAVIAGFSESGVFKRLTAMLIHLSGNTRRLTLILVLAVFFLSMLVTNDVALLTFVPFTIAVYAQTKKSPILVIALETIAANIGSAFTPFGNPNNLYVFTHSGMSILDFFALMFPIVGVSLVILVIMCMTVKPEEIQLASAEKPEISNVPYLMLYAVLFVICVLSVMGLCSPITAFASVIAVVAICEPHLFGHIDYGLLLTFAFIFVFIGNIKNIPQIADMLSTAIQGHELAATVILSQFISNMPTTIMVSGFSDRYDAIVIGANIGSLGTLVSSLASLISLKLYSASEGSSTGKYILVFTVLDLILLAVLYPLSAFVIL